MGSLCVCTIGEFLTHALPPKKGQRCGALYTGSMVSCHTPPSACSRLALPGQHAAAQALDPAAPMQAVQDGATWLLEGLLGLSCASSAACRATNWSNIASVMAADNALGSVLTKLERSSSTRKLHQSQVSHIHIVGM